MAFIPGYKHDIFVSYAHVDDMPIAADRGWVSTFVDSLQRLLAMRLGRADAYSIWMDRRLLGNEPFSNALLQSINESATLMIILSPGYLHSEWCKRERNAFLDAVRNKERADRRVLIVETHPTDREDWPAEFRDLLAYSFWQMDDLSHSPRTLGFPTLDPSDKVYFSKLQELTSNLVRFMKELIELESETTQTIEQPDVPTVLKLTDDESAWLQEQRELGKYDVFLCHNSEDKTAVKDIGEILIRNRIVPWLDEWDLRPGLPWQEALEQQIEQIKSSAVFVGGSGFGPWQNMELSALLREFSARRCPVIPVILSVCKNVPQLPPFLRGLQWVDFRKSAPEPMGHLIWGITGKRPSI